MLKYCEDFPEFAFYIRQRASLRRALWRKIELEYEEALANEFYEAGIIRDDELFLDPLHLNDFRDWTAGYVEEDPFTQDLRHHSLEANPSITATKLKDSKFNPMTP